MYKSTTKGYKSTNSAMMCVCFKAFNILLDITIHIHSNSLWEVLIM